MRAAVVGHVEWVDFAEVDRLPRSGEIVHSSAAWGEAGGGGAVAAVELARLAGASLFLTALGDDEYGRRTAEELLGYGVRVEAAQRAGPQRRAFTFLEASGERAITLLGPKLVPHRSDALPWGELASVDALYFSGGDPDALRAARAARIVVASARELPTLVEAAVELDVLVHSASDEAERFVAGDLEPVPRVVVATAGSAGGSYRCADGRRGSFPAALLPAPLVDLYGAGDCFAAGLAWALAEGRALEPALGFAAERGALAGTRSGAHGSRGGERVA